MSGNSSNGPAEVERLEPWQLTHYLRRLQAQGIAAVTWNLTTISIADATARAERLSPTSTVVADGSALYVAEPDHSPDDPSRHSPIRLAPRK